MTLSPTEDCSASVIKKWAVQKAQGMLINMSQAVGK